MKKSNKNVYTFIFEPIEDDWENVLVYDVETVPDINTLKEVIASGNLDYLNVQKARHVCFAIRASIYKNKQSIKVNKALKEYEKHERDGWVYFTRMDTNAKQIAEDILLVVKTYGLHLIAHNGYRFDFVLFKTLEKESGKEIVKEIKGNWFLRVGKKYYRLIDTRKLIGGSLEKACQSMGIDVSKAYDEDLKAYLQNDVYMLTRLVDALKNAGLKYTLTRTARAFFYEKAMAMGVKRIRTVADEGFSVDYAGGRTEVFRAYAENVNVYDVNSLYPFVMSHFLFPKAEKKNDELRIRVWKARSIETFIKFIDAIRYIVRDTLLQDARMLKEIYDAKSVYYHAKVRIKGIHRAFKDLEEVILRYFPFSWKHRNRRVYSLNTENIYEVEGYEVLFLAFFDFDVIDLYISEAEKLWIADDIVALYEERKKAKKTDPQKATQLKAILVNIYGLFGLRMETRKRLRYSREERSQVLEIIEKYKQGDILSVRNTMKVITPTSSLDLTVLSDEYIVEERKRDFSAILSAPTIATATTSHGRFWLLANIYHIVLNRGGEVYYTDTDSVFTNITLESSEDIGAFKHEGTYKKAFFFAPKTYILQDEKGNVEIAAKGTGDALVKDFITQTLKTEFQVLRRMAISSDRKTLKIPQDDGWTRTLQEEVDYFDYWRPIIEKAMAEIENEGVRNELKTILEEAEDGRKAMGERTLFDAV